MEDRKDIREWFNLFPDPYKKKAFAANEKSGRTEQLNEECALEDSVDLGIVWFKTDEGPKYWERISKGLDHSGLAFFNEPGNAAELEGLDKSHREKHEAPLLPPVIPLNRTLPDAITADELQKSGEYRGCSDIKHIMATDAGHLYRLSVIKTRGEPPEGAFVEWQTHAGSGEYIWVPAASKPPTGWKDYNGNLRWLPAPKVVLLSDLLLKPSLVTQACDIKTLRAVWPTQLDIKLAVDTDNGYRYWHGSFGCTSERTIPRGAVISGMHRRDGYYKWATIGNYEPGMKLPYLVRWLPTEEERFKALDASRILAGPTLGLANYATPGVDPKPEYAKKTAGWWFNQFPEPYRSWAFEAMEKYPNVTKRTGQQFDEVTKAVYWNIGFYRAKQANLGDWERIYRELRKDPDYLNKCALIGEIPVTLTTTTTTPAETAATKKDQTTMTNGTYSVSFLLNKATIELNANKAALERLAAAQEANRKFKEAIIKMLAPVDGKDTPELAALRPIALPKSVMSLAPAGTKAELRRQYFGVTFSYPRVCDNTQKLAKAVAALSAMADDKITWNDDIGFVLQDFTIANGSTDVNDSWSFEIPEFRD